MSSSAGSAQCRSSTTMTAGAWAARPLANRGHARPISSATDSGSRLCSGLPGSEMPAVIASAATVRSGSLATCVDDRAQLLARRRGAVVEDDAGDRPQQLAQRPVREAVAVRQRSGRRARSPPGSRPGCGAGTRRRGASCRRRPRRGSRPSAAGPPRRPSRARPRAPASSCSRPTNDARGACADVARSDRASNPAAGARVLHLVLGQPGRQLVHEHAGGRARRAGPRAPARARRRRARRRARAPRRSRSRRARRA